MEEKNNRVVLPFTLQNPSRPTTPKEADWYDYLKRSHCHKCPEQIRIDCDVEEFLSCEVPLNVKFNKCDCFICIKDKKLREILQDFFNQVEEQERQKEKEEQSKKRPLKKELPSESQQKLFKKPRRLLPAKAA